MKKANNRIIYLDYLRCFAIFAVIMIHVAAQNFENISVYSNDWFIFNLVDGLSRWGVPIFVMISGALFLNKNVSIESIYKKYIFRLVIAFAIWSIIYSIFSPSNSGKLVNLIEGHYHMWFIWMIIGLYICIPFIKVIVSDKKNMHHFLVLSFIFSSLLPWIITLCKDFGNDFIIRFAYSISNNLNNMKINFLIGYSFYFVLGYYLNNIALEKKQRTIIYIFGVKGLFLTVILNLIVAYKKGAYSVNYYDYFSTNVLVSSIAIFVFFKYKKYKFKYINNFAIKLSKYCFGVYLIHVLILEKLNTAINLNTLSYNALLSVLIIWLIVTILSYIISYILGHIPIIKNYII